MKRILLVDDDSFSQKMLEDMFRQEWKIVSESVLEHILKRMDNESFNAIVLNASLRKTDMEGAYDSIKQHSPDIPVIVYTNINQIRLGRSLVKKGAFWNLTMPLNTDDLAHLLNLALQFEELQEKAFGGGKDFNQLEDGIARMFSSLQDKFPEKFTFEQDELLEGIVHLLADILQVEKASLMLLNPDTGELRIKAAKGLTPYVIQNSVRKLGEGIAGWVAQKGEPLLIKDVEKDPTFSESPFYHQYTTKSLVCVPLRAGDRVIGVLSANNHLSGKPFDEKDLYMTTVFSHLLLLTLHNAQLHYDREKMFEKESELLNLNRRITATLEPKVLFHILLNECSSILPAEFAFLFILAEKGAELQVHYINDGKFLESKLASKQIRPWLSLRGESNLLTGVPDQKEFEILRNLVQRDIRCWISAPIIVQDKLAGSIELASPDPQKFSEDQKQILSRIGQQASLAINNAQLYVKLLESIKEISEARKEVDRIRRGQFL